MVKERYNENLGTIIVLASAGLIMSLLSLIYSKIIKSEIACEIANAFQCPKNEIYSTLIGIPIAVFGIIFFAIIIYLANYLIKNKNHDNYHHKTMYFLTLIGGVFTFYMLIMTITGTGSICTFPCVMSLILIAAINIIATRNLFHEHLHVGYYVNDYNKAKKRSRK
jgi:uncharacterized membrane protein